MTRAVSARRALREKRKNVTIILMWSYRPLTSGNLPSSMSPSSLEVFRVFIIMERRLLSALYRNRRLAMSRQSVVYPIRDSSLSISVNCHRNSHDFVLISFSSLGILHFTVVRHVIRSPHSAGWVRLVSMLLLVVKCHELKFFKIKVPFQPKTSIHLA